MNFGQMIYNLIRKKLGKIGINSSARNYKLLLPGVHQSFHADRFAACELGVQHFYR